MNDEVLNKYTISLNKDADIEAFKRNLKLRGAKIKTQLKIAPVLIVLMNDDTLRVVKKWPGIKKLEDEYQFLSLHPPGNY